MIRLGLALTLAGALSAPLARAQTPEPEDNRYQFNRVEDGYLRIDLRNGQVSLCSRRSVGWACATVPDDRAAFESEIARLQAENAALKKALLDRAPPPSGGVATVPDDRAAFESEIARLQGENASLKKALLDRGLQLPGGVATEAPVARGEPNLKPPNNGDIDRMVTAVEKVWRRLVEMLMSLQKDKKT